VPDLALLLVMVGIAQMGVIEVQASRLCVMSVRIVQVRRAGHQAESQIEGTTAQREDPAHW